MSILSNHLDSINLSSQSIGDLEFRQSQPFTNALLHNQEITTLIRDTEPHERGLFTVDPSIRHSNGQARVNTTSHTDETSTATSKRRTTQFTGSQPGSSAVARVLGSDLLQKIQSSNRESKKGGGRSGTKSVDIEVLLQGVEKLCAAYEVAGTKERVSNLRDRHQQITSSIKSYEGKISKQQSSLSRFDRVSVDDGGQFDNAGGSRARGSSIVQQTAITEEDLQTEEEAINELEARKKALEARVAGMERDLGGLRG